MIDWGKQLKVAFGASFLWLVCLIYFTQVSDPLYGQQFLPAERMPPFCTWEGCWKDLVSVLSYTLDNMVKLSEKCNIQVPMKVLNLIDDGKNPDEFIRDVINSCITKNQITKGKADAFKGLHRHLLEELEQAFPDEVESYREILMASAAELKRLRHAQTILPNGDVKVKSEL